jgi:hypothetical protein
MTQHATTSAPDGSKLLLLVVGSGRSGTSLLSGVKQRLGFYVPQPEVAPDETNPTGFGEPQWLVDFHTALLRRVAVQSTDARPAAWSTTGDVGYVPAHRRVLRTWLAEQAQRSDHLLIKDPRLLWFIPLWRRVAGDLGIEVRFATMLRAPSEVVASKERWYANVHNPPNRLAGWINTMLYTERATRGSRRAPRRRPRRVPPRLLRRRGPRVVEHRRRPAMGTPGRHPGRSLSRTARGVDAGRAVGG